MRRSYAGNQLEQHVLQGQDGRVLDSFLATYEPRSNQEEFLKLLQLTKMKSSKPRSAFGTTPLYMLWLGGVGRWLGEYLADGKGALDGFREIDGVRMPQIKIGAEAKIGAEIVWLDPRRGFLPIKAEPATDRGGSLFSVDEFERLESGVWFPKKGTDRLPEKPAAETTYWTVVKVAVNEPLPPGIFQAPEPMIGTLVEGTRLGRSSPSGVKRDPDAIQRQKLKLKNGAWPVPAKLPKSWAFLWATALLAVAFRRARGCDSVAPERTTA